MKKILSIFILVLLLNNIYLMSLEKEEREKKEKIINKNQTQNESKKILKENISKYNKNFLNKIKKF